jgi:hypothetical protein
MKPNTHEQTNGQKIMGQCRSLNVFEVRCIAATLEEDGFPININIKVKKGPDVATSSQQVTHRLRFRHAPTWWSYL